MIDEKTRRECSFLGRMEWDFDMLFLMKQICINTMLGLHERPDLDSEYYMCNVPKTEFLSVNSR